MISRLAGCLLLALASLANAQSDFNLEEVAEPGKGVRVQTERVRVQTERVKIRTEHRHSPDTPNHLVFGMTLYSIQSREARDHDLAVQIVQKRFGLGSAEEAERILTKMLDVLESLQQEHWELRKKMLCGADRVREKGVIYRKMDALDDVRAVATHKHYIMFLSDLDDAATVNYLQWLEERKKTYSYRTAEHASMYEGTGIDVLSYVDQSCADMAVGF